MNFIKRFIYFFYYIKETDYRQLLKFIKYVRYSAGKARLVIVIDIIQSVFKYNISIKDYFSFRFYEKTVEERRKWAGSGFMYEYQLVMNPLKHRELLENKIRFLNHFRQYVSRKFCTLEEVIAGEEIIKNILLNESGKAVLKGSRGQIGAEVEVIDCRDFHPETLLKYMIRKKYDLVEEYVIQHDGLMRLSPSGLNTIRVFTQLHSDKVEFLGARLRITVNSQVDNMAAGNPASPVELETGIVCGPGVFSDITKEDVFFHPLTGEKIVGFQIPYWKDVKDLAEKAALLTPENKSVGWDIAITNSGPELIEGNHNWCKSLWQLPVKKGLKAELEKYL
ncbi:MAG: hexapeptide transferase [Bacteroidales bacterium]|nr:hexapeptide transferase [Bacteroidales bacterium]